MLCKLHCNLFSQRKFGPPCGATPEKASPSWRKMKLVRVNSPELETLYKMMQAANSLKSLTFTKDDFIWKKKEMLRRLNVDDLPQTGLHVKVVYLIPSGNVIMTIPWDDQNRTPEKTLTSFPGFSLTRPTERERDPGKRWSRGSRTKLFLREESFVSHFLSGLFATFTQWSQQQDKFANPTTTITNYSLILARNFSVNL